MASKNEAASRQPVTDCNRLGNVDKMREALEKADAAEIEFVSCEQEGDSK